MEKAQGAGPGLQAQVTVAVSSGNGRVCEGGDGEEMLQPPSPSSFPGHMVPGAPDGRMKHHIQGPGREDPKDADIRRDRVR